MQHDLIWRSLAFPGIGVHEPVYTRDGVPVFSGSRVLVAREIRFAAEGGSFGALTVINCPGCEMEDDCRAGGNCHWFHDGREIDEILVRRDGTQYRHTHVSHVDGCSRHNQMTAPTIHARDCMSCRKISRLPSHPSSVYTVVGIEGTDMPLGPVLKLGRMAKNMTAVQGNGLPFLGWGPGSNYVSITRMEYASELLGSSGPFARFVVRAQRKFRQRRLNVILATLGRHAVDGSFLPEQVLGVIFLFTADTCAINSRLLLYHSQGELFPTAVIQLPVPLQLVGQ